MPDELKSIGERAFAVAILNPDWDILKPNRPRPLDVVTFLLFYGSEGKLTRIFLKEVSWNECYSLDICNESSRKKIEEVFSRKGFDRIRMAQDLSKKEDNYGLTKDLER